MTTSFVRPGVTVEVYPPAPDTVFRTGVAGFVGPALVGTPPLPPQAALEPLPRVLAFTSWPDVTNAFRDGQVWRAGVWLPDELLWDGVQGFFSNGGSRCSVVLYDATETGNQLAALDAAIAALAEIEDVDLVCAPSLMAQAAPLGLQQQLIRSCEQRRDDWFLILDAPPPELGRDLTQWISALRATPINRPGDMALYYPWLVPGGEFEPPPGAVWKHVPASGHVAGIFARTDQRSGVHKAPANEVIEGIVDVFEDVDDVACANAVRAVPGRGIRVWGARTLLAPQSPTDLSAYVGVRRLLLTLDRWLVRALDWTVFESNDFRTWVRVHRELNGRLTDLFKLGAFRGSTPDEAFYVKCDDENNPPDVRAAGKLQIDVGVAPAVPKEFVKIRLVRSADGITVA